MTPTGRDLRMGGPYTRTSGQTQKEWELASAAQLRRFDCMTIKTTKPAPHTLATLLFQRR